MSTLDKIDIDMIIRNKTYEADFDYDLAYNRKLLKMIGLWPTDPRLLTNFDRIIILLIKFLTIFFVLFLMIPLGCHVLFVEKDGGEKIRVSVTIAYCAEALVKFTLVASRIDEIKCYIDMIAADWREVDWSVRRSIMLDNCRNCRIFTTLCIAGAAGCYVFYHILLPAVTYTLDMIESNGTARTPIIYQAEFFIVDSRASPLRECVYICQSIGGVAMCTVNCAICSLTVKFALHGCNRYQLVTALLQSIDDAGNNDDSGFKGQNDKEGRFAYIVQCHLHAIEFAHRIEGTFNGICLASLVVATANICFIAYSLMMEWEKNETGRIATYTLATVYLTSNIFVLCHYGENLAEQCRQVSVAAYMTNWWNLRPQETQALILIISVAQLPLEYTAGKVFSLSMQTFGSVIKVAGTYLNALRTMINFNK